MDNEIQKLSTKLEELKKRLKAINTSQNILSKLITIQDYFDQIQSYLNDLNHAFNNHVISCDEHDQLIKELQEQINSINLKLESLPNIEDYNIEQMSADIESLKQNITDITAEISAFKGNSNSTIETIDNKLTELNQNLEELITKVNTNTSDISSLKTTTQNLSTTQTNLTATQTTLTNNINSIDKRLTKVESNVSTLTGGVDISSLTQTVTELDTGDCFSNCYAYKKVNLKITPSNNKLYTREYYYCCRGTSYVQHKVRLNYMSTSGGNLTINLLINNNIVKTYSVDLQQHPSGFEFSFTNLPLFMMETIKLNCDFDTNIYFNDLELSLYGQGVNFFNFYKDVVVHCFDQNVFVSKIKDGVLYYGKFSATDTIDLENLPNNITLDSTDCNYIEYCLYISRSFYKLTLAEEALLYTYNDGTRRLKSLANSSNWGTIYPHSYTDICNAVYTNILNIGINQDTRIPQACLLNSKNGDVSYYIPNEAKGQQWIIANPVKHNYKIFDDELYTTMDIDCVALNENGYMYYLPKSNMPYLLKIGKGLNSTAYKQSNGDINIYLSTLHCTKKYKLIFNVDINKYECFYVCEIADCDCVNETFNNTIIKHNVSTNSWIVDTLEY